jgi:hypothetical protein
MALTYLFWRSIRTLEILRYLEHKYSTTVYEGISASLGSNEEVKDIIF